MSGRREGMEKVAIKRAVVVEGKYDKSRLEEFLEGVIVTTNGFRVFQDESRKRYLRKLALERGIVILTDSDAAGFVIRNHLKSFLPEEKILNAYIPRVEGKERRKAAPSKEGILGVEGMGREAVLEALRKAGALGEAPEEPRRGYTVRDLFQLGLTGGENSRERKKRFLSSLGLPEYLSNRALLQYMNTAPEEEIREAVRKAAEDE